MLTKRGRVIDRVAFDSYCNKQPGLLLIILGRWYNPLRKQLGGVICGKLLNQYGGLL